MTNESTSPHIVTFCALDGPLEGKALHVPVDDVPGYVDIPYMIDHARRHPSLLEDAVYGTPPEQRVTVYARYRFTEWVAGGNNRAHFVAVIPAR